MATNLCFALSILGIKSRTEKESPISLLWIYTLYRQAALSSPSLLVGLHSLRYSVKEVLYKGPPV